MRKVYIVLLCTLLALSVLGCSAISPAEPEKTLIPDSTAGMAEPEPATEAAQETQQTMDQTEEPTAEPIEDINGTLIGDYWFKITEIYKTPLWETDALFASVVIKGDDGEELALPLDVRAFQAGSELAYMLDPDCTSKLPSNTIQAGFIIQLKNTEDDVKMRLELQGRRFEKVLKLSEIVEKDQETVVHTLDSYYAATYPLYLEETKSWVPVSKPSLPNNWPIGMPIYDAAYRIHSNTSRHVYDTEKGQKIDLVLDFDLPLFMAYADKLETLGYVKSEEINETFKNNEPDREEGDPEFMGLYQVMLTGKGYKIFCWYFYGGKHDPHSWIGFDVYRIREGKTEEKP